MPSRKQRRRRAKDRRHEYEYVYVDEEGREVEVEPEVEEPKRQARPARSGAMASARKIEPASWRRVGRRALLFGPLMFITIRLLERGEPFGASIARTLFLLLIFLPFSYAMDAMLYRSYIRRTGKKAG